MLICMGVVLALQGMKLTYYHIFMLFNFQFLAVLSLVRWKVVNEGKQMVRTTWAWQTVSIEIYFVFFFIRSSVRRDNINRLQDSRISIDSEADTNGKIYIKLSFLNLFLRYLEPDLALWFLGFLTTVFQDFWLSITKKKPARTSSVITISLLRQWIRKKHKKVYIKRKPESFLCSK